MAISTARPPLNIVPRRERAASDRSLGDGLAGSVPHRSDAADRLDAAPRREPAWLVDLTEQITRSVNAIERVVERVGSMREDNSYLRTVTANLREALEAERAEAGRRLVGQGRSISRAKRRTADAERSADTLAGMLCDLERQLAGRRGGRANATYEGSYREGESLGGRRLRQAG